ncbi:hypothetical protein PM082_023144 [Marasmius tenuissimus]|nr:hypothetical protein PM082_023144 [Marasmius tenuissimus]
MPYTRILGHELSNFVGQRVSLTGEVLNIDGHKVTIRTADNEEIMINNLKLTPITTKYIDAIGEAQVDSVIADQVVNAGDNIDLELLKSHWLCATTALCGAIHTRPVPVRGEQQQLILYVD